MPAKYWSTSRTLFALMYKELLRSPACEDNWQLLHVMMQSKRGWSAGALPDYIHTPSYRLILQLALVKAT